MILICKMCDEEFTTVKYSLAKEKEICASCYISCPKDIFT